MKKNYIIPIFVPHLGCPNDCVFCNQKKISGQKKMITAQEVRNTIEEYLGSFKEKNNFVEIAFFGGSFTGIDESLQKDLLEVANSFIKEGKVDSIRISTRPDYINKKILKMLKKYNVKTIELGVQSSNDYILSKAQRGHTFLDVKIASKLIRRKKFVLGHQMMVGLPESTKEDEIQTAKDLIKLKPKLVRIYPVLVIKDTKLEKSYYANEYIPLTVEQATERCKELLALFEKSKINVIRVGLQNSEEISDLESEKSQVVAGPYHPAFRQIVESSLWYDKIVQDIKKINAQVKEIDIFVNQANLNEVIGHKKENIIKIKEFYDIDVNVKVISKIKEGDFKLSLVKTYLDYLEAK